MQFRKGCRALARTRGASGAGERHYVRGGVLAHAREPRRLSSAVVVTFREGKLIVVHFGEVVVGVIRVAGHRYFGRKVVANSVHRLPYVLPQFPLLAKEAQATLHGVAARLASYAGRVPVFALAAVQIARISWPWQRAAVRGRPALGLRGVAAARGRQAALTHGSAHVWRETQKILILIYVYIILILLIYNISI